MSLSQSMGANEHQNEEGDI